MCEKPKKRKCSYFFIKNGSLLSVNNTYMYSKHLGHLGQDFEHLCA